jgi:threonine/homoserine/homoserine lactone efflux protein
MSVLLMKGILLGITLSFMIGPLFFSIVEAALVAGFRAGIAVAGGIWTSDVFFIVLVQRGLQLMENLTAMPGFRFWAGLTGGMMLILFGLFSLFPGRKSTQVKAAGEELSVLENKGYFGQWLKGFLINTFNPGTLLFWLGIATGVVASNGWNRNEIAVFFGSMMAVLIITDLLKIYAAKHLRVWLTPQHILQVKKIIGLVLIVFGLVLGFRAF